MDNELSQKTIDEFFDFATVVASRRGLNLQNWDAVYVLFADRFNWTPSQVRELTPHEINLLLRNCFLSE